MYHRAAVPAHRPLMVLGGAVAAAALLVLWIGRGGSGSDSAPGALAYAFEPAGQTRAAALPAGRTVGEGTLRFSDGSTVVMRAGGRRG